MTSSRNATGAKPKGTACGRWPICWAPPSRGNGCRSALVEAKETLEQRVLERTGELQEQIEAKDRAHAELAAAQQRLIELSRAAGMAEIATGVLHNVGNVLNSVNVSTSLVAGKIRESRVDNLVALIHMLEQHSGDLPEFLAADPKGRRVLPYLAKLGGHFQSERDGLLKELELLSSHVGHIKQIVATQQSYAKVSGLVENVYLSDLVEDALRILEPGLVRHANQSGAGFRDRCRPSRPTSTRYCRSC